MNVIFLNILFVLTALAISPFMVALIKRFSNEEEIFSKDFFKDIKFNWKVSSVTAITVVGLFYFLGVSVEFFIYSLLSIMLIIDAFVDINAQIIPNGLNFTGFLIGIILTYIISVNDIYAGFDRLLGMFLGAGIFLLIAGLALLVYRKEGMGLGDVKLMGMLGLFFGWQNIIQIFILSFFIGAIISVILLVTRIKKMDDYIPFGPFIVVASIITMIIPANVVMPVVVDLFCR